MNLSFCGCGFLGIYQLGVAEALVSKGPQFFKQVERFAGASAGALVAGVLAIRGNDLSAIKECKDFTYDMTRLSKRRVLTRFCMISHIETFLHGFLPDSAHVTATERLFISLTSQTDKRNRLVSQYDSNQQLIQYLLSSCYIPFFTSAGRKDITIADEVGKYLDGGFTDNLPVLSVGRTMSVSPFSGRQDICPQDRAGAEVYANMQNMHIKVNYRNLIRGYHSVVSPSQQTMEGYYHCGYQDALRYLQNTGYL